MRERYTPRSMNLLRGFFDFGEHFMNIPIPLTQWLILIGLALLIFFSYPVLVCIEDQAEKEQWPAKLRQRVTAAFYAVDVSMCGCILWVVYLMLRPYAIEAA